MVWKGGGVTTQTPERPVQGEGSGRSGHRRQQVRWSLKLADDIDEVVVERFLEGYDCPGITAHERREAVRRLRMDGLGQRLIAARLGMWSRQVHRDLRRMGLDGNPL